MTLSAGTRLGPYEILGLIGAGGMGEVYRAKDTRLDRTVAVKILPSDVSADPDRRARFEREAKTIGTLSHSNICTLHDVGDHNGQMFLVMEHLQGETLAHRIEKGPLPIHQALEYGAQIAEALCAAHRAGIIHRDLKPANVMLTNSGVKLLDFGLAKPPADARQPAGASAMTHTQPLTIDGTILGTLHYMAPGQLEGKQIDARADLFALGNVLYEMVTGRRAFGGESQASIISAILSSEPPPPSALQPVTPPALDRIVQHCLTKNADERQDSAHAVANELRSLLRSEADFAFTRPLLGRRTVRRAVSVTGVAIIALALVAWWGRQKPTMTSPRIRSLAVLPFDNLLGDRQQDYFAEGMQDALVAELSKIRVLKVTSRTSTARYRRSNKSMSQIAHELGVEGLVEGSVLREGDDVRITVNLIHGPSDQSLWTDSYQRELRGILPASNGKRRFSPRSTIRTLAPFTVLKNQIAADPMTPAHLSHQSSASATFRWKVRILIPAFL